MASRSTPNRPSALIDVGKTAPVFELADQDGKMRNLRDYQGKWVVLYFYPKDDTSGCTKEACEFRDELPRFQRSDASILGLSPDDPASHQRFRAKYGLTFDLLADEDRKVCCLYGVWQHKRLYGRKTMGVVRTTYLIDSAGMVAHRWDKVKVDEHGEAVLEMIGQLAGRAG